MQRAGEREGKQTKPDDGCDATCRLKPEALIGGVQQKSRGAENEPEMETSPDPSYPTTNVGLHLNRLVWSTCDF